MRAQVEDNAHTHRETHRVPEQRRVERERAGQTETERLVANRSPAFPYAFALHGLFEWYSVYSSRYAYRARMVTGMTSIPADYAKCVPIPILKSMILDKRSVQWCMDVPMPMPM